MRPDTLKKGDKVIVLSPSGKVEEERIKEACKTYTKWGLEVIFGNHVFDTHFKLAGKDQDRINDLQNALDDKEIKAIFCSRGGYGLVRIIDSLEFTQFKKYPKWIVGFSDVTVLHNHVHTHLGIATLHAPMPNSFATTPPEAMESLKEALFEENYQLNHPFDDEEIIGGNLAIIYSLLGTNSDIETKGKVLLLEDVGEYAYNVDRMMHALKKAGKFKDVKGLLIGQFTGIKEDNFGFNVKQIIDNCTQEFSFPIHYNAPIGHVEDNRAIILGK